MSTATHLADWIRAELPEQHHPLTHLKLQKLSFYCFGCALAFDFEHDLGELTFRAWDHGPVNLDIWHQFRDRGSSPIPALSRDEVEPYSETSERHLRDILTVYGRLDAWSLRQESHLEQPWKDAHKAGRGVIPNDALRTHFRGKFAGPNVAYPEYLSLASSFALDGIPTIGHRSLHDLAKTVAGFSRLTRTNRS